MKLKIEINYPRILKKIKDCKYFGLHLTICMIIFSQSSCKKLVEVPPPVSTVTTSQVFNTDAQAESAASSMYYNLINTSQGFASSSMSIFGGLSADELVLFDQFSSNFIQFQNNKLQQTNDFLNSTFWTGDYQIIYNANAIIDGLNSYSGVHDDVKKELIGEAEFVRAFCNFYLTNLFGDIPLVTTINYKKTSLLSRSTQADVYKLIISDLLDAQTKLAADYSAGNTQRIVPNKSAATALLARVYLYMNDWENAETQASLVINDNLYNLTPDLNQVFLVNSSEAIWQLQQTNSINTWNATPEGYIIIPRDSLTRPYIYLTSALETAFEPNDKRKIDWVDSTFYNNTTYYYPYKYKVGSFQAVVNGTYSEYYMVLRLAEQYLIRAEAEAHGAGNGLSAAINDLDIIRHRAGLPDYSGAVSTTPVLAAIAHERQIEFFAEWGHRWFDLKRTGQATTVLSSDKGFSVTPNSLLYPIPVSELKTDPNLTQNPGY